MKTKQDKRVSFNNDVVMHLERLSPSHSQALMSRGTALGWWNTIDFMRLHGDGAADVARSIASKTLA